MEKTQLKTRIRLLETIKLNLMLQVNSICLKMSVDELASAKFPLEQAKSNLNKNLEKLNPTELKEINNLISKVGELDKWILDLKLELKQWN